MIHDRRQSDIGSKQLLGGLTHSEELARLLGERLESEAAIQEAMAQVDRACELKIRFYDQFLVPEFASTP